MRDYKYVSNETLKHNLNDVALDAISQILWDVDILDEARKLHTIDGIMTLLATIEDDMSGNKTEVEPDASADN